MKIRNESKWRNANLDAGSINEYLNGTLWDAVIEACFIWRNAPRGFRYWANQSKRHNDGKSLTKTAVKHLRDALAVAEKMEREQNE